MSLKMSWMENSLKRMGTHFKNTVFGWIASGKHFESQPTHSEITSSVCVTDTLDYWEQEEITPVKTQIAEEIACGQHFQDTIRGENNRFVVQMPLKADVKPLGDNYLQAKRRFLSWKNANNQIRN